MAPRRREMVTALERFTVKEKRDARCKHRGRGVWKAEKGVGIVSLMSL